MISDERIEAILHTADTYAIPNTLNNGVRELISEVRELQEKLKEETKLFADAMHKNAETHLVNGRLTGFLQGVAYRLGVTDAMKTQDIEKLMREVKEVLDRQEDDLK